MAYVEEVDGKWYEINEHRSPDGITHTAVCIGDVGVMREKEDPIKTEVMQIIKEDLENFTSRIYAIKRCKELTGLGLKESVALVDGWIKEIK
jgi:ribosomal protein L7/L12